MSASFQETLRMPVSVPVLPDERLGLHWEVRLSRPQQDQVCQVKTETLSVGRFSFLTQDWFVEGEPLDCTLVVPTDSIGMSRCHVLIPCRAQVIGVTPTSHPGTLSILCRVQHYLPVITRMEPGRI